MTRKVEGKTFLQRKIGAIKIKYSSSSDEWDSDSDEDSSEDSDIDDGSSSESSNEETSKDEHTSSKFSTKSSVKKNKWKFNKQLKKWAKAKFLKNILTSKLKRGY